LAARIGRNPNVNRRRFHSRDINRVWQGPGCSPLTSKIDTHDQCGCLKSGGTRGSRSLRAATPHGPSGYAPADLERGEVKILSPMSGR
jgi:hypothetical protein